MGYVMLVDSLIGNWESDGGLCPRLRLNEPYGYAGRLGRVLKDAAEDLVSDILYNRYIPYIK